MQILKAQPGADQQQLAVLRRAGLVTARREGSTVYYRLTSPQVAELLAVARRLLVDIVTTDGARLDDVAGLPALSR